MDAMTSMQSIPADVLHAVRMNIRNWILGRCVGDRRRLDRWDDHYASLISIQSYSLPGSARRNLARLKYLACDGAIDIKSRHSNIYSFTLPRPILDQLAAEETERYERMGYVVGQIVPEIVSET